MLDAGRKQVVVFVLCLAVLGALPEAIDRYIRAEMEANRIPGLSLAVVRDGAVWYTQAYGVRNVDTGEPMTTETPVELASLSKSFTALAIWRLGVELDEPVRRYLPEFRGGEEVTVRRLLRHASGLRRSGDFRAPCCDLAAAARRLAPEGERSFHYANGNYVLLAAIIERASGRMFAEWMESEVFLPLGLRRTSLRRGPEAAALHERQWGRIRPRPSSFAGWYGSSRVLSTANDMARYLAAVVNGDTGIQPDWAQRYDWGWHLHRRTEWLGGVRVMEHSGDLWGANTAAVVAPELGLAVAVLINSGAQRAEAIAQGVACRAAGVPAPAPGMARRTTDPDFWAVAITGVCGLAWAGLLMYLRYIGRQVRLGRRRLVRRPSWLSWVRIGGLAAMAAYVPYALFGGPQPLASFPATLQIALPLLVVTTDALLLAVVAAAVLRPVPDDTITH